jgi:hypothetical protein
VVLDHEDRVVRHNPSLATILGPQLSDLHGLRLQVRSPDPRIQRLAYLVGDTSVRAPVRRHLAIDEPIHAVLDIEVTPVRDAAGRRLKVVTMHDVTATSDALDAQTHLLRATAYGLQGPLAALSGGDRATLSGPARQLERLRQDLLAVAEPMENLAESARPTIPWEALLRRVQGELPQGVAERLQAHSHPALATHPVPERWLGHLLLSLIEETGRHGGDSAIILDVEGRPGELVFTVRAATNTGNGEERENPLGFGASQSTLSLHVARRLASALGGYLWKAPEPEALRFQLILPTARQHA